MKKIIHLFLFLIPFISAQETGAQYLIITHDNFYNDILPLANWKHKKGMKTRIARLSETGSTSTEIRNYILNAYNTWQLRPEFLLLVGAPNFIPFPYVSGTISDNYYTNMDGDIFNEILSGRLTVHNTTETQTVVNKILLYERTPHMDDSLWMINACLIVNEDGYVNDSVYWNDIRHAKTHMLNHGYHTIDTFSYFLGNNASDVIQSVNNGRAFVLYRGQGVGNWWSPFSVNPDLTNNGPKLPIVLSITCKTIGTTSTPATAERWLLTGTPTQPRGGAGYFATTTIGGGYITFLRSAVCRGFFNALFADSVRTFGEACEGGRQNVYALYSSQSEYAGFTTIGDPEMNVWTGTPCSLLVTHPAIIPTGTASFAVNVSPASSSVPMDGAIVCVMSEADSTIYVLDTADVSGNAQFTIYPQLIDDTIHVTVTGRNLQPYEGEMVTIQPGLYVSYYASTIDDTLGGNGDNLINPNEDINMPLWVKNLGTNTATDVIGILRTSDSYTVITDSIRSFGTMLVNQVCSTGAGGYRFSVAPNAPDGHMVNFDLVCRDINDSSWTSAFEHMIYAPNPAFHEASISGGNGNSTLEPGETVDLVISIKNNGRASLDSADATLQSLTPEVIVLDSIAFFPIIDSGGIGNNSNDPFVIMSDSNITPGTTADLKMTLTSSNCLDTILFSLPINTSIEETNGQNTTINEPLDIYPNPGRGAISINLSGPLDPLHENAISIYDVCGNMVRQYSPLSDKQILNWVGDDEQGRRLPEGVYFVRFTAGNTEQTYKVVLLE